MEDMPRKIVQIQFTDGVWTDVTPWLLKELSVNRGSNRIDSPVIRYEPGKCTVHLDNSDRRFDPTNTTGPYAGRVIPMRPIRILMTWYGVDYPLFRGFIDQWNVSWESDLYSEATVTGTDAFKIFANKRRVPLAFTIGAGEDSGTRVARILDSVGWPSGAEYRNINIGDSTLQATDLGGSALDELLNTAESEMGEFYISSDGKATFRNRRAVFSDTRSAVSQIALGTHIGISAPFEVSLSTDDATLWNEIIASREDGEDQEVSDSTSISLYGGFAKTLSKEGLLLEEDIVVQAYAGWLLYVSKDAEVRFTGITIQPMAEPDLYFPQVLLREIGDRITITYRPSGGGLPITRDVFIRGIQHRVSQRDWRTFWVLQSATKYGAGNFLVLSGGNPAGFLNVGNLWGY